MGGSYFTFISIFIVLALFILADVYYRLSSPTAFIIDLIFYFIAIAISISIFLFRKSLSGQTLKLIFSFGIIIGVLVLLSSSLINQASDTIKEVFRILNKSSILISLPTLTSFFIHYSRNHKLKLQRTDKAALSRSIIYKMILAMFIVVSLIYLMYVFLALYIKTH